MMARRRRKVSKSAGTSNANRNTDEFICGDCHNSGVVELHGGGTRRCDCNAPVVQPAWHTA